MWHQMFVEQIPTVEKILRTVTVYVIVALLVRIAGKRGLAGLNSLDIVVIMLLSNVVQNAIIGNDLSVSGAAIGAATLVALNAALNRLAVASPMLGRILDGTPTTIIRDGEVLAGPMRRLGLSRSVLDHAVRLQNGDDVGEVANGVLEPDGQLVLTLREPEQGATRGDIERLSEQLRRIETALAAR